MRRILTVLCLLRGWHVYGAKMVTTRRGQYMVCDTCHHRHAHTLYTWLG